MAHRVSRDQSLLQTSTRISSALENFLIWRINRQVPSTSTFATWLCSCLRSVLVPSNSDTHLVHWTLDGSPIGRSWVGLMIKPQVTNKLSRSPSPLRVQLLELYSLDHFWVLEDGNVSCGQISSSSLELASLSPIIGCSSWSEDFCTAWLPEDFRAFAQNTFLKLLLLKLKVQLALYHNSVSVLELLSHQL